MIDLKKALSCIESQKANGTYQGARIGRINSDDERLSGVPHYRHGEIVLFREELSPSDSELCLGEYQGRKQKPTGSVTIESPLTQEEIIKERTKGSLITTVGTMIGVPAGYIEEIRV